MIRTLASSTKRRSVSSQVEPLLAGHGTWERITIRSSTHRYLFPDNQPRRQSSSLLHHHTICTTNNKDHQQRCCFGTHAVVSPAAAAAAQQQRQNITKASAVPDILAASIEEEDPPELTLNSNDYRDDNNAIVRYDQIPDDIMALVQQYCQKDVTPVTMHTLVHTGRQELERKTYTDETMAGGTNGGSLNKHNASGRVLIQVRDLSVINVCCKMFL